MVDEYKKLLEQSLKTNGCNISTTGGQPVMHCHAHLIPRRSGDSVNPHGGLRGVIVWRMVRKGEDKGNRIRAEEYGRRKDKTRKDLSFELCAYAFGDVLFPNSAFEGLRIRRKSVGGVCSQRRGETCLHSLLTRSSASFALPPTSNMPSRLAHVAWVVGWDGEKHAKLYIMGGFIRD